MRTLMLFLLALVFALALPVQSDDYQCVVDGGCDALMPGPGGTRTVKFKKGDIVSTADGWIVNPAHGWQAKDVILELHRGAACPVDPATMFLPGAL